METLEEHRCFGGIQGVYRHRSRTTGTEMTFGLYRPPQAESGPVPVLWYLSGLTCTHENAMVKAGLQAHAARHGLMLVMPDTSPRGEGVPDDPDGAYDFGLGAGFYVDATREPWSRHYRMYSYVVHELPELVAAEFPADMGRQGITGHSMGGHGALVVALRNPGRFRSLSAFAPIASPMRCPWGQKALAGYLGEDPAAWEAYDACALVARVEERLPILVDQGDADPFLEDQLKPGLLEEACERAGHPLTLRLQPGYDHSYFFIATFAGDHLAWHARALGA